MRFPALLACLLLGAGSAVAKECRMPDIPAGMQVRLPPECKDVVRTKQQAAPGPEYTKAEQGFVDLGNGTRVRIGGRIRAEVGVNP